MDDYGKNLFHFFFFI